MSVQLCHATSLGNVGIIRVVGAIYIKKKKIERLGEKKAQ